MWPKSLTPEIMYGPRKVNSSSLLLFCLILLLVLFRQSNGQDRSSSSLPSITSTTARDLTIGLSTVSNSMPTTNSPNSNLGPSSTATTTNTGATSTKSNFLFRPREKHSELGNGKGTFRQGRSGQDLNSGSYLSAFYGEDSPTFSGGGGGGNNVNVNNPAGSAGKDQAGSVGGLSAKDLQQLKRSYQNGQFNEIINSMLKDYEQKIYQIPPAVNSYNHGTGAYGGYTFMGPNSSSGKPPQQGLGPHSASVNHPGDPAGLGTAGYNHQYVQQNYQPSSGYKQYQNPGTELYETIAIPISSQYQQQQPQQQQQKFQNQNYLLPSQSQQTSTASQSQSASSGQHSSSQSQQQPQLPPNQIQSSSSQSSDSGPSTIPFDSIFSQALSPEEISFQFTPIYTAPAPQALMPQFVPFGARFPMLAAMAPPPPPPMPPMQPLFPFPRRNFNTYLNPMIMMNGGAMTGTIPFGPQSFIQPGQASQWNFQNYQMPMFQASATTENFMNPFNLGYFGGSGEYGSPDYGVGTGSSSHQFDLMSTSGTSNNRDSIPSKSTSPENPSNPNNNNNNNSKQKISKRLFV